MITNLLFYLFSNILLISALMIIIVQNSIYSVLFLVLSFVASASILFLFECEFVSLMFITIYCRGHCGFISFRCYDAGH